MEKDLVIDVSPSEITIALLEDSKLIELNKEKNEDRGFLVGDVYLGRVRKLLPALNAAFVDIGDKKDAFVHYLDLGLKFNAFDTFVKQVNGNKDLKNFYNSINIGPNLEKEGKIEKILTQGQSIVVQIVKEPISTKGSRLTSEISIAGRNIVLLPFGEKVSLSQKISSSEEKKRLERLMCSILPKNYGVILRTAAEGKKAAVLDAELRVLIKRWEDSWRKIVNEKAPQLLFTENSKTTTILRDLLNESFSNIYVNDEVIYNEARNYISLISPDQEKIVKLYKGSSTILDHYDVTRQIKSSFGKVVTLRQGAYLVIEHTEALHVIDVNSGSRGKAGKEQGQNAYDVNIIAAQEVARQIKLRDMGGIIIVDFIDMDKAEHKTALLKVMQELMSADRVKHNILPLTKFGLMQITRHRVKPTLEINTMEECPTCHGKGKVASSILIDETIERQIAFYVEEKKYNKLELKVNPILGAYLSKGFFNSIIKKWRKQFACSITLKLSNDLPLLTFEIKEI